jgi:paraquat-inducible protein B
MLRFPMPAVVMVGALVVLLAGALGDAKSLPNLSTEFTALVASVLPNHTEAPTLVAPSPAAAQDAVAQQARPSAPIQQPATDALPRQVVELQAQVAKRAKELGKLRSNEVAAHHELDTLQQQRKDEEAAVAGLQSQQQQLAAAPPAPAEASAVAAQQKAPNDVLQRQATELQAQIEQRSQQLASLGASD